MLGTGWSEVLALVAAYVVAVVATPAGISGAVLLLPFQVSVLGTPSPSVTPTNLLYNVVSTPGALYRYWRQGQTGGRLALLLIGGTLPGVIAGSVIRVKLLPGPRVFDVVVAAVLIPLGVWLLLSRPARTDAPSRPARQIPASLLVVLAMAVGCVGGIYGIGGGAILAPGLIGSGRSPSEVAPAALASTFVTSAGGVDHFHHPVPAPAHLGGSRLADGYRPGPGRPGRGLYRCAPPVPDARCLDPLRGRRPGHRHRGLLLVVRPRLTLAVGAPRGKGSRL